MNRGINMLKDIFDKTIELTSTGLCHTAFFLENILNSPDYNGVAQKYLEKASEGLYELSMWLESETNVSHMWDHYEIELDEDEYLADIVKERLEEDEDDRS